MSDNKDDRIKAKAHEIWEREGRKHGEHERHWHEASREVESEGKGSTTKVSKTVKSTTGGKGKVASEGKVAGKKASAAVSTKSMDENASVLGDDRDKSKSPTKAMPDDGVAAAVPKTAGAAGAKAGTSTAGKTSKPSV